MPADQLDEPVLAVSRRHPLIEQPQIGQIVENDMAQPVLDQHPTGLQPGLVQADQEIGHLGFPDQVQLTAVVAHSGCSDPVGNASTVPGNSAPLELRGCNRRRSTSC